MSVILKTPSNGSVTLAEQDTASDVVVTVPARTGNVAVDGPAFSAYAATSQTITSNVFTKLQVNTELFDTNSNFNTTNYRFTPTVAGYYQVNAQLAMTSTSTVSRIIPAIYKNGVAQNYGTDTDVVSTLRGVVSSLIYMNGTTDYLEFYILTTGSGTLSSAVTPLVDNYFQGYLARAA